MHAIRRETGTNHKTPRSPAWAGRGIKAKFAEAEKSVIPVAGYRVSRPGRTKEVKMGKKSRRGSRNGQFNNTSKQGLRTSSRSSKLPFVIIALVIIGVGGYLLYNKYGQEEVPVAQSKSPEEIQRTIETLRGHETRMTLMPALFTGKVAQAYQIAHQYRDLLDVIYCYCYCEKTLGHKSLLSCYVDRHAANCDICEDQAIFAASLYKKGFDMVQVRQAVDKKFWKPFR